jgi:hypothetical protein
MQSVTLTKNKNKNNVYDVKLHPLELGKPGGDKGIVKLVKLRHSRMFEISNANTFFGGIKPVSCTNFLYLYVDDSLSGNRGRTGCWWHG